MSWLLVSGVEVWNLPPSGARGARSATSLLVDHWHDAESEQARAEDSLERLGGEAEPGVPVICGKRVQQVRSSGGSQPCPECLVELQRRGLSVVKQEGGNTPPWGVFDLSGFKAQLAAEAQVAELPGRAPGPVVFVNLNLVTSGLEKLLEDIDAQDPEPQR